MTSEESYPEEFDPDPEESDPEDPDFKTVEIPVLEHCKKCDVEILKGVKLVNKFYTFCLCSKCMEDKTRDTEYITIDEPVYTLNISDIENIHFNCSTNLHGGIGIYYYFIYLPHKKYGFISFKMHIEMLFKILIATGDVRFLERDRFLKENYDKYLKKDQPVFKIGDTVELSANCILKFDKIYVPVMKKITLEYEESVKPSLMSELYELKKNMT
jgi:hypothetical protein